MTAGWARLFILAALPAANAPPAGFQEGPYSGIPAEMRVQGQIAEQIQAWNRGDLETALAAYCPSANIVWVNKSGVSRGYESFASSMRAEFGGRPAAMGTLAIAVENALDLGENESLVTIRWSIIRGGKRLMGGVSSQLWAWCDGRMRVVFEHAS